MSDPNASGDPGATNQNSAPPSGEPNNAPPTNPPPAAAGTPPAGDPANPPSPPSGEQPPAPTDPKAQPPAPNVPEKYEFKAPEGIQLDEALVGQVTPIFKELGLNNEAAQKIVDAYAAKVQADQKAYQDVVSGWSSEVKNDPDLGGQKFDTTLANAQSFLARFDPDGKTKAWLAETRLGDNINLVRVFAQAGAAMAEDQLHRGAPKPISIQDRAVRMFPNSK